MASPDGYLPRTIDTELDDLLPVLSAIAIDGAKGVGKTDTCSRRGTLFSLDQAAQRARAAADPRFTSTSGTIVIDEWQYLPEVWNAVRHAVDDGAAPGRYLMTGSATPAPGMSTHTGAARIASLRMRPMGLHERGLCKPTVSLRELLRGTHPTIEGASPLNLSDYLAEIVATGFPGIRPYAASPRAHTRLVEGYVSRIFDREMPEAGMHVRRPESLRRWLRAYAAACGTATRYSQIAQGAAAGEADPPSRVTVTTYREHLSRLWLLDPMDGWSPSRNPFTRLQVAPKHYLADPGLEVFLQGLDQERLLDPRFAAQAGHAFESLAVLTVRVLAQACDARVGHLRTGRGDHEVDLIVEDHAGRIVAIEVKLAADPSPGDARHLNWLATKVDPRDLVERVMITTGQEAYRWEDGTAVIPLALLGL